ncbi:MAG: hypothetical protein A2Y58_00660 [Chloroflexi bacterium RBG_13_51_52]|nr:MAG: hypothetical protein A2Y58_00660 [Chloroflexi bacterium RBG_13_51_52]
MDSESERIEFAARHTEIVRHPRQHLATFGVTNIYYYLLTEPVYSEFSNDANETVIREGRVIAERPKIVTPYYLTNLEGFSYDARQYFEKLLMMHGPNAPGLFYTYKNEPKGLNIVSDSLPAVVEKLNIEIDKKGDPLATIIKGQDDLWDVSLLKFIYEITSRSVQGNMAQLGSRGLLGMSHGGIPVGARQVIEEMFQQAWRGEIRAYELERELNQWGAFEEYQDRFFALVKGK